MRCAECGGTSFVQADTGEFFCATCNVQSQDFRDEAEDEFVAGRVSKRRKTAASSQAGASSTPAAAFGGSELAAMAAPELTRSEEGVFYLALQRILRMQCQSIKALGVEHERLADVAGFLWLRIAEKCMAAPEKVSTQKHYDAVFVRNPPLLVTVITLYMTTRFLRIPVVAADIVFWALQDRIPYFTAYSRLPPAMSDAITTADLITRLRPVNAPAPYRIESTMRSWLPLLMPDEKDLPSHDHVAVVENMCRSLLLSPSVARFCRRLMILVPPTPPRQQDFRAQNVTEIDYMLAYIIVAMLLIYRYNGDHELYVMTANDPHPSADGDSGGFERSARPGLRFVPSWRHWIELAQRHLHPSLCSKPYDAGGPPVASREFLTFCRDSLPRQLVDVKFKAISAVHDLEFLLQDTADDLEDAKDDSQMSIHTFDAAIPANGQDVQLPDQVNEWVPWGETASLPTVELVIDRLPGGMLCTTSAADIDDTPWEACPHAYKTLVLIVSQRYFVRPQALHRAARSLFHMLTFAESELREKEKQQQQQPPQQQSHQVASTPTTPKAAQAAYGGPEGVRQPVSASNSRKPSETAVVCPLCGDRISRKRDLRRHLMRKHPGQGLD